MADTSLKNKTVKGVGWSAADSFLGHGVTFLVGIVLARILSPSEYGLLGICMIFITVLNGIVDCGFSNAIIRKKDATDEDYSTMFITNLLISLVLYLCLFWSAPYISIYFKSEELCRLIRVSGLVLISNALSLAQVTKLTKKIDFKTKTKSSLISAIASGVIGILMAYSGFEVWSLITQQLSKQVIYTICLWTFSRWYPSFVFSKDSFIYLWGFGFKLLISGILNNIWNQLYQVVVGRYYSPVTLGQYTKSNEFAGIVSSNITTIIQRVSYPVLADIQNDSHRMVAVYRRIIRTTMLLTCVSVISLGAVAEPFIYCLIGPQWHEAATYLPLICIISSTYPLQAINLNMLQVLGRSDIFLRLEIIKKGLAVFPLLIGIFVNIYFMLIASILVSVVSFFLNSYYTGKKLGYTSFMQLKDVSLDYLVSVIVAISVYFLKYLPFTPWVILLLQIFVGGIDCFVLCETLKLPEYLELKSIALTIVRKLKV